MKKLNYFFVFLFFIFTCTVFLPQKNLFYLAEVFLEKNKIYISKETFEQKIFGLEIKNLEIIYEEIKAGNIQNVQMNFLGFHNKLTLHKATIEMKNFDFIPKNIKILEASYNLFSPQRIVLFSENDLGIINGYISLSEQKLFLELQPNKEAKSKYNNILKIFTAQKEGLYTYEKNIKLY